MASILLDFRGAARRLSDIDIPRIGSIIDVGEDELHAFMEVEATGSGFDSSGRPKMLFEPHIFYRQLSPGSNRDRAVAAGLAYKDWGTKPYPKESYARLADAMAIDEQAALKSCSWGLGQIMGSNHKMVGYATVQAMILDFMDDEAKHLEAVVQFLIESGIDDDLRAHRWEVVARVYNGVGYAKNQYDVKLAKAFAKWAGIPDTPWENVSGLGMQPTLIRGAKGEVVKALQKLLGIYVDGDFGSKTEGAVKTFQLRNKLTADGKVGPKTWAAFKGTSL